MDGKRLKVINLFGGPGVGKSKVRAGLFSMMKEDNIPVEEVTEFAKDVTWEENFTALSDQLYVLGNQNRRLSRLVDQIEWVITDSPLLLGIHYATANEYPLKTFEPLVRELWDQYENYNVVLSRTKPYHQKGRTQNEAGAKEIDGKILRMLDRYELPYVVVPGEKAGTEDLFRIVKEVWGGKQTDFA